MTAKPFTTDEIKTLLKESLELIQEHKVEPPQYVVTTPLPSLFEQLRTLTGEIQERPQEPVRIVHHLACTGGTLLSKYLAAMPNTRLLSEIDPLSPISKPGFNPLNLALQYQQAAETPRDDLIDIFLAGLKVIYQKSKNRGERLVLRSHCHSHFNTGPEIPERPSLEQIIAPTYSVRSILTVRHPLDSFLSLKRNKFVHFSPGTLEEYARRYLCFLDTHHETDVIKYEDFVLDQETYGKLLCQKLELPWTSNAVDIFPALRLTGDSGRSGSHLALRKRRPLDDETLAECIESTSYQALCRRLDYSPGE